MWKTLWEEGKLLVTSNFSFSHSVFKRPVLQTRKIKVLFGKGLKKITGKREIAVIPHFLFFEQCFRLSKDDTGHLGHIMNCIHSILVRRVLSFAEDFEDPIIKAK